MVERNLGGEDRGNEDSQTRGVVMYRGPSLVLEQLQSESIKTQGSPPLPRHVSRLGLVVRRAAGKREGRRFDSPLRLTFLFMIL